MTGSQRMLFICQAHHTRGGMEQWLGNFTAWLQRETDWDIRVALPRGRQFNDPTAFLEAYPHLQPMVLDVRVGTASERIRRIVRAIDQFDPDIVVPIATGDVFHAVPLAKRSGSRSRFVVPVRAPVAELMANVLDHWAAIDGVVSVSRLFERFFRKELKSDLDRVHYVRHGARPAVVDHDRSRFDDPSLPLRAGFVGRIEPDMKRIFDLLPFTDALSRGGTNVEIHLFGSGPAEDELRSRLASAAVPVTFHGFFSQERLYLEVYPNLDAVLLFSRGEGSPNVIVEAMHHGCVPVVSRYPGLADEGFVLQGRNGFTFPVGDMTSAADSIGRLARDRQLLATMSDHARNDVRNDTDVRMHRDWLAIFEKTLALPQKIPSALPPQPPGGRLDRIAGVVVADAFRSVARRYFPHPDAWSEWPGSEAAAPERNAAIAAELRRLDREAQLRIYGEAS